MVVGMTLLLLNSSLAIMPAVAWPCIVINVDMSMTIEKANSTTLMALPLTKQEAPFEHMAAVVARVRTDSATVAERPEEADAFKI